MKQYCRYCSEAVYGDVWWCEYYHKIMNDRQATSENHCAAFDFLSMAADNPDLEYRPHNKKANKNPDQIKMF